MRPGFDRLKMALLMVKKRRYMFLLSHMRSYSSLLGHVFGSHPQIAGYTETHHSYQSELDLVELALKIYHTNGRRLDGEILFDKVLHGKYEFSDSILERNDVHLLFVLREPLATIRSTVAMARRRKNPDWKGDAAKVGAYYEKRVHQLVAVAGRPHRHSAFLLADDVMTRTDDVLSNLGRFLDLSTPLQRTYETFEFTGKPTYGDPGKHISSGTIVTERDQHDDIAVDDATERSIKEAFDFGLAELGRRCDIQI